MSSLNISLPEKLRQYIEQQIASGDWSTPGEYIRELIRQDKERRLAALEEELLEGVRSATLELPVGEVNKQGLVSTLRRRAGSR
jgi:antitoxin ParD1/3/4